MRILLTDDYALVRQGLKLILHDHFKTAVFGEARNTNEALARIAKDRWDVVVLDITMPGRSGLDVLREIKRLRPKLPVLILSMHPEDQFAVRMLKSGAVGYLVLVLGPNTQDLVDSVPAMQYSARCWDDNIPYGIRD